MSGCCRSTAPGCGGRTTARPRRMCPARLPAASPVPTGRCGSAPVAAGFCAGLDGRFIEVPAPDAVTARGYIFNVLAATRDRSGRLWASVNGIGQFYRQDERWTFVPVLKDRPDWTAFKAHADAADRVWLAYRDELAMLHDGKVRLFTKAGRPRRRAGRGDRLAGRGALGRERAGTGVPAGRSFPRRPACGRRATSARSPTSSRLGTASG